MRTVVTALLLCLSSLLPLPSPTHARSGPDITVTFVLRSPDLAETSTVYITGGIEQLGNWDPGKIPMEYAGDHKWTKKITLAAPLSIEYKYTLGSWEREGAGATGSPLSNFAAKISHDTVIEDTVLFWTKAGRQREIHGQVTGTVRYHRAMKGAGIRDRDVIVWLPPGYEEAKRTRYPVLYMHDGQNIIDPATSSFGVDWEVDETLDGLIRRKAIAPIIVVGIYNTADRSREYTPGETGTAYMNFVVKTVKPFIDSTYRTKPDRNHTLVGGSSAGGIISFMLVWEHPDVFSKAICMSPAFKIRDLDYVKVVRAAREKRKGVFFYIDNGGVGLESELQPGVDDMLAALRAKGYREGREFVFVLDPAAKHFESDWAKRFPQALTKSLAK
jgi:predicted alpha/beta superfamily hydrolase